MKFPHVIYKTEPKSNSWCRWAVNRVKNRFNSTNIRFIGDTGSGKTYSAIAMAEIMAKMLGRKFTEKDIYFSIRDIITEVADNDPKPASMFLLDEQQVSGGAKEHQSKRNKAYAIFMSTVRNKRYIFLSTLPFSDMADKQVRRLFHVEIETAGVDLKRNVVRCKPRYLEHSRIKDKVYRKRLVITYIDPKTGIKLSRKLGTWDVPKPSEELVRAFELKKAMFQKKLYKQLSRELTDFETAKEDKNGLFKQVEEKNNDVLSKFTRYQVLVHEAYTMGNCKTQQDVSDYILAKGEMNSSKEKVSVNIKWMKRKGWMFLIR